MARPRDPLIDDRILAAAIDVYAATGWTGFTFDAVARAADVGKPAVYLRWSSREELLFAAADLQMPARRLPDTGTIRGDLIGMADEVLDGLVRGPGAVIARLQFEVTLHPEPLERLHEKLSLLRRAHSGDVVRRAIRRGQLRPDTPIIPLIDLVVGATVNHWRSALPAERPKVLAQRAHYIATIVDAALASFASNERASSMAGSNRDRQQQQWW
jgi:AcrR family transcriptional regulator